MELQRLVKEAKTGKAKLILPDTREWREKARDEQLPPGHDDWRTLLLRGGRGSGKALDRNTLIPTPSGWKKLGDVAVGDSVFDENGEPCRVTGTYDRQPQRAYRVTFSDGSHLDACDEHQWVTWTHAERKALGRKKVHGIEVRTRSPFPNNWAAKPSVTTEEISATLTHGTRGDRNHCIPTAGPLRLPDADLPLEPYVLGFWLGDGIGREGAVTIGADDAEASLANFALLGETLVRRPSTLGKTAGTYRVDGLQYRLRRAGVLGNKHVPAIYLRASAAQRLALLQGLMDTDGYALSRGTVEFTSTSRELADSVVELARSLGQKPVLSQGRATLYGKDCGPKYRVTWRPTVQVFRLPRKAARIILNGPQFRRSLHRMIIACDPIEPMPMRCLTVDSPNHMYLAGEAMIPTHNSWSASHIFAEWVTAEDAAGEWAIIAPSYRRLRRDCLESQDSGFLAALGGENGGWLKPPPDGYNRGDGVIYLINGAVIYTASSEDGARLIQGKNLKGAWCEELGLWENWEVAWDESLRYALRKGRSQVIATGTPKFGMPAAELIIRLVSDPSVISRQLRTQDNAANLSERMLDDVMKMAGTRLGRQELEGELIEDNPDALWHLKNIDSNRVGMEDVPDLGRIVVAVDPAVTSKKRTSMLIEEVFDDTGDRRPSDETGIIVMGVGDDGHGYVLADVSGRYRPDEMARVVATAFNYWAADRVVVEVNNGGDYIPHVIATADPSIPVRSVRATRGKFTRAEPVAACYSNNIIHHVGHFPDLEQEMCFFVAGKSDQKDDRVDALVWAATELNLVSEGMSWDSVWSAPPKEEETEIVDGFKQPKNPWLKVYEQKK